jgi:DHA1 family bicyclomycin/chloramphenicol resistance-like MFS transporter
MFIFLTGQGLVNPNAAALSLAPFSRNAGSAAALMGSFRMTMGGLASAGVSLLHNNTALPMVGMMALCAISGLLLLFLGKRSLAYGGSPAAIAGEEASVLAR